MIGLSSKLDSMHTIIGKVLLFWIYGPSGGSRTHGLVIPNHALSHLSYTWILGELVSVCHS